jgi:hypothetical protein
MREGGTIPSIGGIASSRHSAGIINWHQYKTNINDPAPAINIIDKMPPFTASNVVWQFAILNQDTAGGGATAPEILQQLRDGQIDDILVVMSFAGVRPAWN